MIFKNVLLLTYRHTVNSYGLSVSPHKSFQASWVISGAISQGPIHEQGSFFTQIPTQFIWTLWLHTHLSNRVNQSMMSTCLMRSVLLHITLHASGGDTVISWEVFCCRTHNVTGIWRGHCYLMRSILLHITLQASGGHCYLMRSVLLHITLQASGGDTVISWEVFCYTLHYRHLEGTLLSHEKCSVTHYITSIWRGHLSHEKCSVTHYITNIWRGHCYLMRSVLLHITLQSSGGHCYLMRSVLSHNTLQASGGHCYLMRSVSVAVHITWQAWQTLFSRATYNKQYYVTVFSWVG